MMHVHCMHYIGYKYTQADCVILIAFPLHQWFHERASVLRCMYIARLVCILSRQMMR